MTVKRTVVGVLLAHPPSWTDKRINAVKVWLMERIRNQSTDTRKLVPNVISSRHEWFKHYTGGMAIEDWVREVLNRTSPVLGTRRYQMLVVPGKRCGGDEAIMIAQALNHTRIKVRALVKEDGTLKLRPVLAVTMRDSSDDMGWDLSLAT